jgi:Fe-S-cluster-containing dehydrogenase component
MQYHGILFNSELCVGCQTCEVACKHEHGSPVGVNRIRVLKKGPYMKNGKLRLDFHPIRCMHCTNATCMEACPVDAISRAPLGIVTIDDETCTGCKLCIEACPIAAPQLNPEKGVVELCNLCSHRTRRGLPPMCVKHCMTKALQFGEITEITKELQERKAHLERI